jgi:hypothetical protein
LTADAVCHALEQNGVRCWIAPRDVHAGANYGAEIINAIKKCQILVLIFSENSNNSEDVKNEIQNAFKRGKIIIPYRLDDIALNEEMEYFLSRIHWIDAYPNDKIFVALVNAAKMALGQAIIEEKSSSDKKPNWFERLFSGKHETTPPPIQKTNSVEVAVVPEVIIETETVVTPVVESNPVVQPEPKEVKKTDDAPKKEIQNSKDTTPTENTITVGGFKISDTGITRPAVSSLLAKGIVNEIEAAWLELAGDNAWLPSGRVTMIPNHGEVCNVVGNSLFFDGTKNLSKFLSETFSFENDAIKLRELSSLEFIRSDEANNQTQKVKLTLVDGRIYEQEDFHTELRMLSMILDNGNFGEVYISTISQLDFNLDAETTLSRLYCTLLETIGGQIFCSPYESVQLQGYYRPRLKFDYKHYIPAVMHSIEFRDESIWSEERVAVLLPYYGKEIIIPSKAFENEQFTCFTSDGIKKIPLKDLNRVLFHRGGALSFQSRDNLVSQMLACGTITETAANWIRSATESFVPRGRAVVQLVNGGDIEIVANSLITADGMPALGCDVRNIHNDLIFSCAQIVQLSQKQGESSWFVTLVDGKKICTNSFFGSYFYCIDKDGKFLRLEKINITSITFYHEEAFFPTTLPYVLIENPNGQSITLPQAILLYERLDPVKTTHIIRRDYTHNLPGKGMHIAFSKIRSLVTGDGYTVTIEARNGEKMEVVLASSHVDSGFSIPTDYGRLSFPIFRQAKTTATFE